MLLVVHEGTTSNGHIYTKDILQIIADLARGTSVHLPEESEESGLSSIIGIVEKGTVYGPNLMIDVRLLSDAPSIQGKYITPSFLAKLGQDGTIERVWDLHWVLTSTSAFSRAEQL